MQTRRIADRLLSRLLGVGSAVVSARRRSLAMNGTDQERRALVSQPELDARVLEILARRGPDDVTMAVARHPALQLETARNLLRINNQAFAAALENRFGNALKPESASAATISETPVTAAAPMAVAPATELTAVSTDIETSPDWVMTDSASPHPEPTTEIAAPIAAQPAEGTLLTWSMEDFAPQAPLGTDFLHPATAVAEPEQLADSDYEIDFLSAVEEFEDDLDRLTPLLGHDQADASEKYRARTDRYDEAAEIRFMKAFQRIPSGYAGERLLAALSRGANAPKFHKLLELYSAGLNVDEVAVAWTVRESWNAATGDKYGISYRSIGAIVRSFAGTPDPDEVLQLLGTLRDNFHLTYVKSTRFFNKYAEELAEGLEASERAGQYVPLDLLAAARNYR